MASPEIIAVMNQKGGVGKTTTAVNLAAAFAIAGKRVVLVDLDPQGNATTSFGITVREPFRTVYALLLGKTHLHEIISPTYVPNLQVISATPELAGAEVELVSFPEREKRLSRGLQTLDQPCEYMFIDCPPSLGMLALNALVAASTILIPVQCEFYALDGLRRLVANIERVRTKLNPSVQIEGILLTMFDGRSLLNKQVVAEITKMFGERVISTVIPRSIKLAEASSHGTPAILYDHKSPGSRAYLDVARLLLEKRVR